ncbi:hypothetical protein [Marinobacter sp.]|uniref:hypothetical protein n=1 Tax=Marinobacter sp. TaxID=50741 RepID=UPI003A953830
MPDHYQDSRPEASAEDALEPAWPHPGKRLYTFTGFKSSSLCRKLNKVIAQASDADQSQKDAFNLGLATGRGRPPATWATPRQTFATRYGWQNGANHGQEHDCIKTEVLDEKQMADMGMNTIRP